MPLIQHQHYHMPMVVGRGTKSRLLVDNETTSSSSSKLAMHPSSSLRSHPNTYGHQAETPDSMCWATSSALSLPTPRNLKSLRRKVQVGNRVPKLIITINVIPKSSSYNEQRQPNSSVKPVKRATSKNPNTDLLPAESGSANSRKTEPGSVDWLEFVDLAEIQQELFSLELSYGQHVYDKASVVSCHSPEADPACLPPMRSGLNPRLGHSGFSRVRMCWTMPLVGGFPRGSPVFPALSIRRCSILTLIARIGSHDLDDRSRRNLFTHLYISDKPVSPPRFPPSHSGASPNRDPFPSHQSSEYEECESPFLSERIYHCTKDSQGLNCKLDGDCQPNLCQSDDLFSCSKYTSLTVLHELLSEGISVGCSYNTLPICNTSLKNVVCP
ncbi:hypothetical protein PR048_023475 [Dryococelus australis]|uniref:Uncharacterized protein n=1 Tax=Dryococelus australis TaxID=614101 RepID=A0ABQ9GUA6_9NEOP|nr:hypothetical protein PR048_023475 [Dryococelus australis]